MIKPTKWLSIQPNISLLPIPICNRGCWSYLLLQRHGSSWCPHSRM